MPNRPASSTTATSLTSGEAIRNDSVTPSGTPADTKPMNAGTAEHEQNGVATPRPAAAALPTPSRRPPSSARVRSMLMNERSDADGEHDAGEQQRDLGRVVEEEPHRLAEPRVQVQAGEVAEQPVPQRRQRLDRRHPHDRCGGENQHGPAARECAGRYRNDTECGNKFGHAAFTSTFLVSIDSSR